MRKKSEVITFKADEALALAMRGVRNRSEFIRNAVLSALDGACPLCGGTGVLSRRQREHMRDFLSNHDFEKCVECGGAHPACRKKTSREGGKK